MSKRVRVTIELPNAFVGLLKSNCELLGITKWLRGEDECPPLDPRGILAMLILAEACGETECRIDAATPPMWRDINSPTLIHEERRVYDD